MGGDQSQLEKSDYLLLTSEALNAQPLRVIQ